MAFSQGQRWALSLAGAIHKMNDAHPDELGGWGENEHTRPWCRNTVRDFYGVASAEDYERMARYLAEEGHSRAAVELLHRARAGAADDDAKTKLVLAHASEIEDAGLLAWDIGRLVAVVGWSSWAGYVSETAAWKTILAGARRVQTRYDSWASFAAAYELGRLFWSGGKPHEPTRHALAWLLEDAKSPWRQLPWHLDLSLAEADLSRRRRFKRTVCPSCGAPKSRPSLTAFVYCDFCGGLADFDFQKACETDLPKPGPAYEQLLAQVRPSLNAAQARADVEGYRTLQRHLFDAYVTACPQAVPFRTREPRYRSAYVDYMASGATATAFDPRARQHEATVAHAAAGVTFSQPKPGVLRVPPAAFERVANAVFDQQQYLHGLYEATGVYRRHPDRAPPAVQQRIGYSLFVQGWLPMLAEQQAAALLERSGLKGEYIEAEPPQGEATSCAGCGAPLVALSGAKRAVCEHCGHKVCHDARLPCPGCGAALSPLEHMAPFACPHCQVTVRRVA